MTHMLKCMLENDVFVNVKLNKINSLIKIQGKKIKVQENIKKICLISMPFQHYWGSGKNGFLMKKSYTVWKWNK